MTPGFSIWPTVCGSGPTTGAGTFGTFAHTEKQTKNFPIRTHVVNQRDGRQGARRADLLTGEEHRQGASVRLWGASITARRRIFNSDEHYAGKDPIQGTEVCAVVEYMFSLENLIQILGDPAMGDRLEKIAFNALPGTFSADMKAHQYDQQANQVLCTIEPRPWTNNNMDSNVLGSTAVWLLHGELPSGVAEICRQPLDGDGRRRARRRGLRSVRACGDGARRQAGGGEG